jgi:septum site-determining protein MinC
MTETLSRPGVGLRGRSFRALVIAPEPPFGEWFAALDRQISGAPGLFDTRPVVVDLAGADADRDTLLIVLDGLEARDLRVVAVEGSGASLLAGTRWARLATLPGRDVMIDPATALTPAEPAPLSCQGSLLVDRPVRSGQSVVHEAGDVIVVGAVASGAEVIAGGSVHVYGALRGRAIAGLRSGAEARIFCRRLEAELVGIDQLYRTAEHWGPELQGRAVEVRCDRGALRLSAFD